MVLVDSFAIQFFPDFIYPLRMIGWTHWDKHLSEFKGKPVHILEVGVYTGAAMEKFAECFLDLDPNAHYYGVDTWEGSPEYTDIDFKEIEKAAMDIKKKSPSKSRIHIMKKSSAVALPMLLSKGITFDIIFIDASHVAKDVLFDGVLCMNMLKENGVLIFDDYLWTKLKPAIFTPKPAIDSIMKIYEPEIEVLYSGYQVILKKVSPKILPTKSVEKTRKNSRTKSTVLDKMQSD